MKRLFLLGLVTLMYFACSEESNDYIYENGTYKAIDAEYNYGWKSYLNVTIKDDEIASLEFDYINEEGDKKSETTAEEYPMDPHPSVWLPQIESMLMSKDITNFEDIDAITGATHSCDNANKLMNAVLEAAKTGDTSEQVVE